MPNVDHGRDITTSGFDFDFFTVIGMWFCVGTPNFIQVGPLAAELWRHSDFQDDGSQPCWIWFRVMVAHPRSASGSLCFILKFRLDRIYSFGDCYFHILALWLEIAYSRPLLWGFGGIFSPNDVIYRCNPQKTLPCAETRRLSHKAWKKSVQRFDLGAGSRKRTGQDSQKIHKGVIFHLFGEKPPLNRFSPQFAQLS